MSICCALTLASDVVWKCINAANQKLRVGEESLTDIALLIVENVGARSVMCKKWFFAV
jgi:hypothetical protein